MANYFSNLQRTSGALLFIGAVLGSAQVAVGQYTFVQATTSPVEWWDTDRPSWSPSGIPNGDDVSVMFNTPVINPTSARHDQPDQ